jgi:HEAT repeat protein
MIQNDNRLLRADAAKALGEIGDPKAVDPLIDALGDKDSNVRYAAAMALGKINDEGAVEELTRVAQNGKNPNVQEAAAKALGKIQAYLT